MFRNYLVGILIVASAGMASAEEKVLASVKPYGLSVGDDAPAFSVNDIQDKKINLDSELAAGPVVLVFYRGGWCPFCNTQLRSIESKLMPALKSLNASLVAISVDKPDEELKTKQRHGLSFRIVSDPKAVLLGKYNVKYQVPDDLVATYKAKHEIDLEKSSGEKHHIIAVPAVFVVNKARKVVYSFVDEDYKKRAPEEAILAAVAAESKNVKK